MDPELVDRVAHGDYAVDSHAVARAILDRVHARRSAMLVAAQLLAQDPRRVSEDDPLAGEDTA
jgi:hypothetical protein